MPTLTEDQLNAGRAKRHELQRKDRELNRRKVLAMLALEMPKAVIARELGISRATVYSLIRELESS